MLPVSASATKNGKLIALTFDDGPSGYTQQLLDGLKERGAKVTFFLPGQCAEAYPETVRREYREGHQIAQHTYSHAQLSAKTDEQIKWELNKTDGILNGILGKEFKYALRPPYGDNNARVLAAINRPAFNWSIDPVDWRDRDSDTVCNRIVNNAFDGAIILVHDIHRTTIPGALRAIDRLQAQGYEFVTIKELFRRRGVKTNDGCLYVSCKPNGTDLGPVVEPTLVEKTVYGGKQITLTAQDDAEIYYSTDGSEPAENGIRYTAPFVAAPGQTVKYCAAYDLNGSRSDTVSRKIEGEPAKEPTLKAEDGMFVFENPNTDTDVFYTTDGSVPTAQSMKYTAPFASYNGQISYCVMGMGIGTAPKSYFVSENGNLFLDVQPKDWFFPEIDFAAANGLLNGTAPHVYEPNSGLTRAMFVTMLYRMYDGKNFTEEICELAFSDVKQDSWYKDSVYWAAHNGIVNGYEDGTFRPEAKITREEMCAILDRVLVAIGKEIEKAELSFADTAQIGAWAQDSVARLVKTEIIRGQGNNLFAPKSTATRAEAAAVLHRLDTLIQE